MTGTCERVASKRPWAWWEREQLAYFVSPAKHYRLTAAGHAAFADNHAAVWGEVIRAHKVRPHYDRAELFQFAATVFANACGTYDHTRGNRFITHLTCALSMQLREPPPPDSRSPRGRHLPGGGVREQQWCEEDISGTPLEPVAPGPAPGDEAAELEEQTHAAKLCLRALDQRERAVLVARCNGLTLDVVAWHLALTKERVRQIEKAAVWKVRAAAGLDAGPRPGKGVAS